MNLSGNAVLSIQVGSYVYIGRLNAWRGYARALTQGQVSRYRQSAAFGNQSLAAFFNRFVDDWDARKGPPPRPEDFNLIPLQPSGVTQAELIREMLKRPEEEEFSEPLSNEAELISEVCGMREAA